MKIKRKVRSAIKEYLECGAVSDFDPNKWDGHQWTDYNPWIFEDKADQDTAWRYGKYDVPVWVHLNHNGHTLIRGMCPRTNRTFLHIILEDARAAIKAEFPGIIEITGTDIEFMD